MGADAGEVLRHEAGGEDGICVAETGGADTEQDVLLGGGGDGEGREGVWGVESVEDLGFHCWGERSCGHYGGGGFEDHLGRECLCVLELIASKRGKQRVLSLVIRYAALSMRMFHRQLT